MRRKIELMHEIYGEGEGVCKDCKFLLHLSHHDKSYYKCSMYGESASEATDWRCKSPACGLKNIKSDTLKNIRPLIHLIKHKGNKKPVDPIQGQMTLF